MAARAGYQHAFTHAPHPVRVEYATDIVFRSATLKPLYEQLARESALNIKAEQIATFLRGQIAPQPAQEIGNQFLTPVTGASIQFKHRFGKCAI